ncbi:MAG: hypothetical protein PHV05_00525 [Candidatus Riflebacteria bacterium]|nr:hypothetical protein [Candidatus Riflebacteria bacterium]
MQKTVTRKAQSKKNLGLPRSFTIFIQNLPFMLMLSKLIAPKTGEFYNITPDKKNANYTSLEAAYFFSCDLDSTTFPAPVARQPDIICSDLLREILEQNFWLEQEVLSKIS